MPSPSTNLWLHNEQRYRELDQEIVCGGERLAVCDAAARRVVESVSGGERLPTNVEIWERRHEILGVHAHPITSEVGPLPPAVSGL